MRLCSKSWMSEAVFAGVPSNDVNEILHGFCGFGRIDDQCRRCGDRQRYGVEVLLGIEERFGKKTRAHNHGAEPKQHSIAVGRCLCRLAGADVAANTTNVLDVELLLETLAQFLGGETREDVGCAAWRKRHD